MWLRFKSSLRCPLCSAVLQLRSFKQHTEAILEEHRASAQTRGILDDEFAEWVESGLLLCDRCLTWYPIWRGLPVLLPYGNDLHTHFAEEFEREIRGLGVNYTFPHVQPVPGEAFVMKSFSKEWLEYDYDGVIWTANYGDYELTFLREVNFHASDKGSKFLEIGCGLGITTSIAQKHYQADAVGVDLSLAALKACQHWKANPFLHFIEASAFYLPLRRGAFDVVYSRGVLHHTFSTEKAFKTVAPYCRPGGKGYLWVYGPESIHQNWFRRAAYGLETVVRPILSRRPTSLFATVALGALASGYMVFNALRRLRNSEIQRYTFQRALHAARDRFTPLFAHRQDTEEVSRWFRQAGFEQVEAADWRTMPPAEQDNFRRNVGVRGIKGPSVSATST